MVQSFECIKYGVNALARLGDRCWPAIVASAGTRLLPMAALLLAAPMSTQLQVCLGTRMVPPVYGSICAGTQLQDVKQARDVSYAPLKNRLLAALRSGQRRTARTSSSVASWPSH